MAISRGKIVQVEILDADGRVISNVRAVEGMAVYLEEGQRTATLATEPGGALLAQKCQHCGVHSTYLLENRGQRLCEGCIKGGQTWAPAVYYQY